MDLESSTLVTRVIQNQKSKIEWFDMNEVSTVYGPVNSWRVGRSLGVDLLALNSICSFRCVYCQLGRINVHTAERRVYVPTWKMLEDLRASAWRDADIIPL